jgi:hypothetical protein
LNRLDTCRCAVRDGAWSFPSTPTRAERVSTAQVFHCDINEDRTVELFFYLTDV